MLFQNLFHQIADLGSQQVDNAVRRKYHTAVQSQKAASAYFTIKQILHFGYAEQYIVLRNLKGINEYLLALHSVLQSLLYPGGGGGGAFICFQTRFMEQLQFSTLIQWKSSLACHMIRNISISIKFKSD